jgi:hypothetical protein
MEFALSIGKVDIKSFSAARLRRTTHFWHFGQ